MASILARTGDDKREIDVGQEACSTSAWATCAQKAAFYSCSRKLANM
jgi:hypothetical protein